MVTTRSQTRHREDTEEIEKVVSVGKLVNGAGESLVMDERETVMEEQKVVTDEGEAVTNDEGHGDLWQRGDGGPRDGVLAVGDLEVENPFSDDLFEILTERERMTRSKNVSRGRDMDWRGQKTGRGSRGAWRDST